MGYLIWLEQGFGADGDSLSDGHGYILQVIFEGVFPGTGLQYIFGGVNLDYLKHYIEGVHLDDGGTDGLGSRELP